MATAQPPEAKPVVAIICHFSRRVRVAHRLIEIGLASDPNTPDFLSIRGEPSTVG